MAGEMSAGAVPQPSGAPTEKTTITLEIPYQEKISRLFIFRFLWAYVVIFTMIPWAMYVGLVGLVHFFYMLFLGKRHQGMFGIHARFLRFAVKWQSYLGAMTDKRPNFTNDN